ncbi:MAG TPA: hypothetical protein VGL88_09370 [Pseudonocardiaceae bacterium]|jgi:hypothetical protein
MSDELNFTELDAQQVELLPARTVLSMLARGNDGGVGGNGTDGAGKLGIKVLNIPLIPGGGNGFGTPGGSANG